MEKSNLPTEQRCRACLQQSRHQMYSLRLDYVKIKNDEYLLAELYHQCTQLDIDRTNFLCDSICQKCFGKFTNFFLFREMCIDSNNTLERNESAAIKDVKVEDINVFSDYLESNDDRVSIDDEFFNDELNASNETIKIHPPEHIKLNDIDTSEVDILQIEDVKFEDHGNEDDSDDDAHSRTTAKSEEKISRKQQLSEEESEDEHIKFEDSQPLPSKKQLGKTKKPANTEKSKPTEALISCELCPMKFFKKHRYDAHKRKHLGLKQWQCEKCEKAFEKYTTLKTHMEVKHFDESEGRPEFICDINDCGKIYSQKETLRIHMKKVHYGIKPKLENKICEQCGKTFKSNAALLKHSYTHTKVTPHKCDLCAKMFATKYKLKEHQMRHDGIKNFVCPTCGSRKTTGHELRVHMKFHSTDLQFPCDLCSLIFTRPSNMKRHMKIVHCGVKAFACPHCDRSFGKAETLKHHVMTHTGERPLACTICDKRFIQPVALKTHMKTHNKSK